MAIQLQASTALKTIIVGLPVGKSFERMNAVKKKKMTNSAAQTMDAITNRITLPMLRIYR